MTWKAMQVLHKDLEAVQDWTSMNKLKFNPDEY